MKKLITIFTIFLFLFPIISAVEFTMNDEFKQGETLFTKISGNFLDPPLKENIQFLRGHIEVPMEFDIGKIDQEYYIYAKLPENSANYSLKISEVKYYSGSKIIENDLLKNFSITNQTADFSVEPGFVITNKSFFVKVQNLKDYKITISIKTNTTSGTSGGFFSSLFEDKEINDDDENSVTLKSGEIKKINFELSGITQTTLKTIELSTDDTTYQIPIYILGKTQEWQKGNFRFEPSSLDILLATDSETTRTIYLENNLNETIGDIILSVSEGLEPYITLSKESIDELGEDENARIDLEVNSDSEELTLDGQIKAEANSSIAYLSVTLKTLKDFVPSSGSSSSGGVSPDIALTKVCSELGGVICEQAQECGGEVVDAKDDKCCLGVCEEKPTSSTGKIIGWSLIVIILCALVWFLKFYKKGRRPDINLLDIARGKK